MHHEGEEIKLKALFMYWCLNMLIQQILSIQALFIRYGFEKSIFFMHSNMLYERKKNHFTIENYSTIVTQNSIVPPIVTFETNMNSVSIFS